MISGIRDNNVGEITPISKSYTIAGKTYTFETGSFALLIDGAVTIRDELGHVLLTTAGVSKKGKAGADWFPLSVDYQERFYATGNIGGGRFNKREARPTTSAILNSRLIDRPIRPMFPKGTTNEVQIIPTIYSATGKQDFGVWGITGASIALQLAGVHQFEDAVSGVRLAVMEDGGMIFDPTFEEINNALYELTVAGTADIITMVEMGGKEASEEMIMQGFVYAQKVLSDLSAAQKDFIATVEAKYPITKMDLDVKAGIAGLEEKVFAVLSAEKIEALYNIGKIDFHHKLEEIIAEAKTALGYTEDTEELNGNEIGELVYKYVKKVMRKNVLETGRRLDGRKGDEVRPIMTEVGILPLTHGSGHFRRGVTSVLSIATLGGPLDNELVEGMYPEYERRYMHHYNFPPYSVGEIKMMRGVGRREVGHGNLAEKALMPVLPKIEEFGYTVRVVSEVHTCNGSSSMGSVCGSTLALMDAGVPISAPVSGVAMGMVFDDATGKYVVLSDIQAQEDFLGDMDFKVAGTRKGITALQMDTKIDGLTLAIVKEVFEQAKGAREFILQGMLKSIDKPRSEVSKHAPALISMKINPEKIGMVIGKGGETIQDMQKYFGVEISIEDDGTVVITGPNKEAGEGAKKAIENIVREIEIGQEFDGEVVKILEGVGAIVEIGGGKSGMIHISKLSDKRIARVEDVVNTGDKVHVKVIQVDNEKGRIGLQKI
jgi:polyribonucleotide nucleotidyltransferase